MAGDVLSGRTAALEAALAELAADGIEARSIGRTAPAAPELSSLSDEELTARLARSVAALEEKAGPDRVSVPGLAPGRSPFER